MAIVPFIVPFLFEEGKRQPYSGDILQLGRQAIYFSREELSLAATASKFELTQTPGLPLIPYQFEPKKSVLSDTEFFKCLGFGGVDSLDFDDREGNTVVFDLNAEIAPDALTSTYDFIFDGGTMEHIFHLPNALKNLHRMIRVGGRIMHCSPASNQVEHGFYSFSPCFFIDYYTKNGYELLSVKLLKTEPNKSIDEGWFLDLFPGHTDLRASLARIGGLDGSTYSLVVVARKLPTSTCGQIPTQGCYQKRMPSIPSENRVAFPWENEKWVFPWQAVPCFKSKN